VFNEGLMNDAVYKFKRYEDASLTYTGIDKHTGENVGLYNTVLSREDYNAMAGKTEESASDDAILANVGYTLRYRSYLPLYSLRAACGVLGDGREVAPEGWVKAEGIGKLDNTMVVVRAEGDSMEPKIHDGDLCVVRKVGGGNYADQIVLVQRNDKSSDPESGGAYLLKKLVKKGDKTLLRSINHKYSDIAVERNNDIAVVAYLHKVLNG
jgi:SOS-response transcriptional repressor LexA